MVAVADLVDDMDALKEDTGTRPFERLRNSIKLENLKLDYGSRRVLNNINLEVSRFSTIALVGESGAGKTTLANVIAGLVKPTAGRVLIDDIDLKEINLDQFRARVGYISQETVVFNDSIYNNITFWDEPSEKNVQRFWDVVEIASLTEFIKSSPNGEKTVLGDSGKTISLKLEHVIN